MPLSEKALIARIRRMAKNGRGIVTGIGDDCAVLRIPAGHEALVTTDFSLEGVHFRRDWHPPEVVGHRCLARGFSDIAAMGGEPAAIFVSLALPKNTPQKWVDGFTRGLLRLARQCKVPLAGGDTAQSPGKILADIIVLGSVPRGKALLRSGAKPGDVIYVSGVLGGSAAALKELRAKRLLKPGQFAAHFFPAPRIEVGRRLRGIASAMIDISDGLSTDLAHICEESGVGARIQADAIPRGEIGRPKRRVDLNAALHGGDDYEMLFTVPLRRRVPARIAGVPITPIGRVTPGKRVLLEGEHRRDAVLEPKGWQHFKT